ncbi:MAG: chorismate mutase [Gemmatimonadetes bacterium]|nr:chorismate mutase [Gemmatimonadota bacterium]|tara:strand:- start:1442 stop:1720 length:279 start_codon:yes stop_codon:yes gene_type:complete
MDLEDWRKKIDEINGQLLELLSERARCALEVGKIKRANGQPIYVPERETAVLRQLESLNEGPLSNEAVQRIFRQIIDEARRLEQEHVGEEAE